MHVLHANWSGGKLWLWAESAERWAENAPAPREDLGEEDEGDEPLVPDEAAPAAAAAPAIATATSTVAREHVFAADAGALAGLA
jgi:hypothetical protein